jgi:hypothetical protein
LIENPVVERGVPPAALRFYTARALLIDELAAYAVPSCQVADRRRSRQRLNSQVLAGMPHQMKEALRRRDAGEPMRDMPAPTMSPTARFRG